MALRMQHLRVVAASSAALALLVLAPACAWPPTSSGSGSTTGTGSGSVPATDPPVIDSLDMSASASAVNGTYTVFGSITYHDDDDVVVSAQVYVYVTGKTLTVPVTDPESMAAGVPFSFNLSADVPLGGAGPTNYTVTLTNKSGVVSQPYAETVTLL